jgi:hypothetical protein
VPGDTVSVGVVANPASGRDVRRLVTGASVFDNAEKGAMVHRLMAGLGAAGVDRVLMMPAGSGVSQSLQRHLGGRTGHLAAQRLPELECWTWRCTRTSVTRLRRCGRWPSGGWRRLWCWAATAPTGWWPGTGATSRCARCPPAPTTPSPSCERQPSPGWRPGWSRPRGWRAMGCCDVRSSSRSASTGASGATAPWWTWRSPPSAGWGRAPCGVPAPCPRRWSPLPAPGRSACPRWRRPCRRCRGPPATGSTSA